MSIASNVYDGLYDVCLAALNPTFTTPTPPALPVRIITIPVLKGHQDQAGPTGTYVAISDISLDPYGTPDITAEGDDADTQIHQDYTCSVALWEVNGDGSALATVLRYLWTDEAKAALAAWDITSLSEGPIDDVSMNLENRWIKQHRVTVIMGTASTDTRPTAGGRATTISWASNEFPNTIDSVTYPIPSPGP